MPTAVPKVILLKLAFVLVIFVAETLTGLKIVTAKLVKLAFVVVILVPNAFVN